MRRYLGFVSSTRKHTFPRGFGKAIGLRYDPMVAKPNGSRKKPDLTMGQWRRLFDKLDASKLEDDLMRWTWSSSRTRSVRATCR
jgi:hypothetical protein